MDKLRFEKISLPGIEIPYNTPMTLIWEGEIHTGRTWTPDAFIERYCKQHNKDMINVLCWWGMSGDIKVDFEEGLSPLNGFIKHARFLNQDDKEHIISSRIEASWSSLSDFLLKASPCVLDIATKVRFSMGVGCKEFVFNPYSKHQHSLRSSTDVKERDEERILLSQIKALLKNQEKLKAGPVELHHQLDSIQRKSDDNKHKLLQKKLSLENKSSNLKSKIAELNQERKSRLNILNSFRKRLRSSELHERLKQTRSELKVVVDKLVAEDESCKLAIAQARQDWKAEMVRLKSILATEQEDTNRLDSESENRKYGTIKLLALRKRLQEIRSELIGFAIEVEPWVLLPLIPSEAFGKEDSSFFEEAERVFSFVYDV